MLNDKVVLITGGTGSLGKKCVDIILKTYKPKRLIIFSRDESKQFEMSKVFSFEKYPCIRYFIGDVRDPQRLHRAFVDVDYVIHTAALKHVPASEYNPFETVKTNIIGSQNIINAAIDQKVKKVIAISTDKAASPTNLYGATKLCADKIFIAGNSYTGEGQTMFSVVRFGNFIGSRGSVINSFLEDRKSGLLKITDKRMTRFWVSLRDASKFVLFCLDTMVGGELFVPKLASMSLIDVAKAIAPDSKIEEVGIRAGERLHEVMIPEDDARYTLEYNDYYITQPCFRYFADRFDPKDGKSVPDSFEYSSNNNSLSLSKYELMNIIGERK